MKLRTDQLSSSRGPFVLPSEHANNMATDVAERYAHITGAIHQPSSYIARIMKYYVSSRAQCIQGIQSSTRKHPHRDTSSTALQDYYARARPISNLHRIRKGSTRNTYQVTKHPRSFFSGGGACCWYCICSLSLISIPLSINRLAFYKRDPR